MVYDYLIVGAGLFGSVFSYEMKKAGKKCLVIEKNNHIGGNIYSKEIEGIQVHQYGAHIFHTSNKRIWEYINQFSQFNHYVNSPIAIYKDELYNLPFNMNTFSKMWNIKTPEEAKEIIRKQINAADIKEPTNLEEQAISLVGTDVYEKLIKEYTQKQWGRPCNELPAFIIKRLPLRFTYDNNYFNDSYQGIPIGGYTRIIEQLLEGTKVLLNMSYQKFKNHNESQDGTKDIFAKIVYTGMIDEYFNYQLGELEYRSLKFEHEVIKDNDNYQGNAVVNYTERSVPFTRIIEHKHFEFGTGKGTIITKEYPSLWKPGDDPYYPINDDKNMALFEKYLDLANNEKQVLFGGRLGQYKYYDMDKVIEAALEMVESEFE